MGTEAGGGERTEFVSESRVKSTPQRCRERIKDEMLNRSRIGVRDMVQDDNGDGPERSDRGELIK